ncbi:MAG: ATP-dependent Clp protease ATP-binding subunit [Bryobacterales bacterium]|nr:ATP-dependent Clp protease ATP-binding subunit [Bryobacterales bacterium]
MRNTPHRIRRAGTEPSGLLQSLTDKIVGQDGALEQIVPYVEMYHAGLAPEGRPVGVFLLLGPTGTGKTRTVEALAGALHGNEKALLRVDCGEFQMEHEVAKLIGAPPGYLGHRETTPMLTQAKLNAVTSETSNLSIVLFDEIEKAAPSLNRLLLGVLDKATLKLGDNSTVNFERTIIFLTSNLGARGMNRELHPTFGFEALTERPKQEVGRKLEQIAMQAVKKRFTPEFVNRIDVINTYMPLDGPALDRILDHQVADFQRHIRTRLGQDAFYVELTKGAREFLLRNGTSEEFGARELKRTIHRHLVQPIASLVARGEVEPGSIVLADCRRNQTMLSLRCMLDEEAA